MEARLFSHGKAGGFNTIEDLRSRLDKGFRKNGIYFLPKQFDVPSNSLVFFEMKDTIIGCAVVHEGVREMTEEERREYGDKGGWRKAIMRLDSETIWVWQPEQYIRLKEVQIPRFYSGAPKTLTMRHLLNIFRLVAERSK